MSHEPWLHDPLVHDIPWRYDLEREILELTGGVGDATKVGKLAFGLIKCDGQVQPVPPVRRALAIVTKALTDLGHEIVEWDPPPHKAILDEGMKTWVFDGGEDVKAAFDLSGEPMCDQISFYKDIPKQFTASEVAATNVRIRQLRKEYMEYWNSTVDKTSTGRPVDAVISPVAPFPAPKPKRYTYYGYSTFVNVLDYTSVVFPVTNVDKSLDKVDESFKPIDNLDKQINVDCEYPPSTFAKRLLTC